MKKEEKRNERKGLFPELGGLVKLMYKIEYVDDASVPFKKFIIADIAVLTVLLISGFFVRNIMTVIFSGFFIFVAIVLLLANNYKTKGYIQFKVGRGLVVLMALMTLLLIFMTIYVSRFGGEFWEL